MTDKPVIDAAHLRGHLPAFIAAPGTQAEPTDPGQTTEGRKRRTSGTSQKDQENYV